MVDKNLLKEASAHRGLFILTVVFGLLGAGAILVQTWFVAKMVDGLFLRGMELADLWPLFACAVVALLSRVGLEALEDMAAIKLSAKVQGGLRAKIIAKLAKLAPTQLDKLQQGKILGLLYDGVDTVENYFSGYLPQLYKAVFIPLLFLVVVFPRDFISGVIMLVTIPLIPMFMILIGKWTKRESVRQWIVLTKFSAYLEDVLEGLMTLKSLGRSKKQGEKIGQISEAYRKATFSVQKWAFISSLALELVATISIAMVAVGLGLRLCNGTLDFLTAFYILLLAPEYYQPMRTLGQYFHASINAQEASNSIYDFLAMDEAEEGAGDFVASRVTSIRFDHVSYRYPDAAEDAVKDVSITLEGAHSVAFVGESGSGKSTLMMLAMGFLQPTEGRIYVNDVPLDEWQLAAYQERLAAVLQRPYIFRGSVAENIALETGLSSAHYARVDALSDEVGLAKLLRTTKNGLDTTIGQGGVTLSGGQTALMLIARALYRESDVLFLDEMTDNLDVESEKLVVEALTSLTKEKMSWIIAHRLQTLREVDDIIVLEKGRIVKRGRYSDVVDQNGKINAREEK